MFRAMSGPIRVLVLLNPGRTSRNYLVGLARAAERSGVLAGVVELGDMWREAAAAKTDGAAVQARWAKEISALCGKAGITHVISYVYNGALEFGLHDDAGLERPLFPAIGVRHVMLWTDHPNWATEGSALDPRIAAILADPMHRHIVKSRAAADELAAVCGWHDVRAMNMAEDYEALQPVDGVAPIHDAVAIVSDAAPPPDETLDLLGSSDPDPVDLMQRMAPAALRSFESVMARCGADDARLAAASRLALDWIEAKLDHPLLSFHRLAMGLRPGHAETLEWLSASPQRWYRAVGGLGALTVWRRWFWLAWLGRRVNLGIYGSSAQRIGLPPPPGGEGWIDYTRQPAIYALGRSVVSINAAHDEEGLTHKPFQIAASGAACVHHASIGLGRCFDPGDEVAVFERGPELLDAVRSLAADVGLRRRMGESMRERARACHTWDHRLAEMLDDSKRLAEPRAGAQRPVTLHDVLQSTA